MIKKLFKMMKIGDIVQIGGSSSLWAGQYAVICALHGENAIVENSKQDTRMFHFTTLRYVGDSTLAEEIQKLRRF